MKKLVALLLLACSIGTAAVVVPNFVTNEAQVTYAEASAADQFISDYTEFRSKHKNICAADAAADFKNLYSDYLELSPADKAVVDNTKDPGDTNYTIKQSIDLMVKQFMNLEKTQKIELNKGNTLTIVIVLAVFGMTAICGFFLLKNKNIIE